MHSDPAISIFVLAVFCILIFGAILRKFKQPSILVYLIVGLLFGPNILGLISDQEIVARLGALGVIFLMFFIGMEISPRRLVDNWVVSIGGTLLQVFISVGVVALMGFWLDWSLARVVLLGFVISISSTAVILKLLDDWEELDTRVGQNVLGILLVQDLIIVPMMICLGLLGGITPSSHTIVAQCIGGVCIVALSIYLLVKDQIRLRWLKWLGPDHEMELFVSLGICFGMSYLTGLAELSAPLGAFVGGMIVSSAKETSWVHERLSSIRTLFIALFFFSIGMLININFMLQYWWQISMLVVATYLTNLFINALILKALGDSWSMSLYGGVLLSQIGEFSFVLAAVGFQAGIINEISYQMTISVITLTLFFSPFWIGLVKKFSVYKYHTGPVTN